MEAGKAAARARRAAAGPRMPCIVGHRIGSRHLDSVHRQPRRRARLVYVPQCCRLGLCPAHAVRLSVQARRCARSANGKRVTGRTFHILMCCRHTTRPVKHATIILLYFYTARPCAAVSGAFGGVKRRSAQRPTEPTAQATATGAKFCSACGAPLPDGARFCTRCGKPR